MNKTIATALGLALAATATVTAAPASAHNDRGYIQPVNSTCSGQMAYALEARLNDGVRAGGISPRTAGRIHDAIGQAADRAQSECYQRDWRGVEKVTYKFRDIGDWIQREALQGYNTRGRYDGNRYGDGRYGDSRYDDNRYGGNYGPGRDGWNQR